MYSPQKISRIAGEYIELENCYLTIVQSLQGVPSDNRYNVSIEAREKKTKFWIICFGRKILANFSSFGEYEYNFLGKITFEIEKQYQDNLIFAFIYFDKFGNNYLKIGSPANPWSLIRNDGREPFLSFVLSKYLEFMQSTFNNEKGAQEP